MLTSPIVAFLISTVLGFLAGLGVGGGSLLILWLTIILKLEHSQARIINLLFFIPSALIASFFRWRQGTLNWKKVIPGIVIGCIVAGICSFISSYLDLSLIKRVFGFLLIITGIRELLYKEKSSSLGGA